MYPIAASYLVRSDRARRAHAPHRPPPAARQRGVVLFTSLILLMILTMVGVMLSRMQTVEEQISQNDQDHQLAVQAAEATLRYAEEGLGGPGESPANCATNSAGAYTWQSGVQDYYLQKQLGTSPNSDFLSYAGPALPVYSTPLFLVECLPTVAFPGAALNAKTYGSPTPSVSVYRITAYSYGGDNNTIAELQEIDWQ